MCNPVSSIPSLLAATLALGVSQPTVVPAPPLTQSSNSARVLQSESGSVDVTVRVVNGTTPLPVAETDFRVLLKGAPDDAGVVYHTDDNGHFKAALGVGTYVLSSVQPTLFKDKSLSWSTEFTVQADKTTTVSLTDADAKTPTAPAETEPTKPDPEPVEPAPAPMASAGGNIVDFARRGIVSVQSENGQATGFVVDASGLVVTDYQIVSGSASISIRFGSGPRVIAVPVVSDPAADIAILRFNPSAVGHVAVLQLPPAVANGNLAAEGDHVIAVGSPLGQSDNVRSGTVTLARRDTLAADVQIGRDNSGGPLLNASGQVIGVASFTDPVASQDRSGSRIVPVTDVEPLLSRALKASASIPPPSADPLPDLSPVPIPASALANAPSDDRKPFSIKAPGNFTAAIYTPFSMNPPTVEHVAVPGRMHHRREFPGRREDEVIVNDDPLMNPFWQRYGLNPSDAFVLVEVKPQLAQTNGSQVGQFFSAIIGGPGIPPELRFRDNFAQMELFRGGKKIEPLRDFRSPTSLLFDSYYDVRDAYDSSRHTAEGGMYVYDPSAFAPGEQVVIRLQSQSKSNQWFESKLDPKEQQRIWDEFAPYRDSVASAHTP